LQYLTQHGLTDNELTWFRENTAPPDVVGINYYPMWSTMRYDRDQNGAVIGRERNDGSAGLEELVREFSQRYGAPVMVTETSFEGSVTERVAWLRETVATLARLRGEVDIAGFIWWPFLDQVRWQYRESLSPRDEHLHRLGLVTLEPDDGALKRQPNQVFDEFRSLAADAAAGFKEPRLQQSGCAAR